MTQDGQAIVSHELQYFTIHEDMKNSEGVLPKDSLVVWLVVWNESTWGLVMKLLFFLDPWQGWIIYMQGLTKPSLKR